MALALGQLQQEREKQGWGSSKRKYLLRTLLFRKALREVSSFLMRTLMKSSENSKRADLLKSSTCWGLSTIENNLGWTCQKWKGPWNRLNALKTRCWTPARFSTQRITSWALVCPLTIDSQANSLGKSKIRINQKTSIKRLTKKLIILSSRIPSLFQTKASSFTLLRSGNDRK